MGDPLYVKKKGRARSNKTLADIKPGKYFKFKCNQQVICMGLDKRFVNRCERILDVDYQNKYQNQWKAHGESPRTFTNFVFIHSPHQRSIELTVYIGESFDTVSLYRKRKYA